MLISLLFSNLKISYLITFQIINYVIFFSNFMIISYSLLFKLCNCFNYSNFMHISCLILNLSKCKKKFTRESEKNFFMIFRYFIQDVTNLISLESHLYRT